MDVFNCTCNSHGRVLSKALSASPRSGPRLLDKDAYEQLLGDPVSASVVLLCLLSRLRFKAKQCSFVFTRTPQPGGVRRGDVLWFDCASSDERLSDALNSQVYRVVKLHLKGELRSSSWFINVFFSSVSCRFSQRNWSQSSMSAHSGIWAYYNASNL